MRQRDTRYRIVRGGLGALFLLVSVSLLVSAGCSSSWRAASVSRPAGDVARETAPTSRYRLRLGTEDELQFNVHIWGQVANPGLYSVPDGTDLVSLISLAGGPTDDAKLTEVILVRGESSRMTSFAVNLQGVMSSGARESIPILEPGDTVIVPAKVFHTLFRFTGILSVAALIANVIVTAATR